MRWRGRLGTPRRSGDRLTLTPPTTTPTTITITTSNLLLLQKHVYQ